MSAAVETVRKDAPRKVDAQPSSLPRDLLQRMDAYWRAANASTSRSSRSGSSAGTARTCPRSATGSGT
jgi:hypothetical protein